MAAAAVEIRAEEVEGIPEVVEEDIQELATEVEIQVEEAATVAEAAVGYPVRRQSKRKDCRY